MSCNHCSTKFNFFHKELGCSNCGISLCSKCLKQKCTVPSKGSGEFNVCKTCYRKLTSPVSTEEDTSPPDTFLKRLEKLGNSNVVNHKQELEISRLKDGMTSADQGIADRLAKLKEKQSSVPTEHDIRERLTSLKGDRVPITFGTKAFNVSDTRTEQEKVDSLLEQLQSEQSIEKTDNPVGDLSNRLSKLKGEKVVQANSASNISSEDSEEELSQITKKIMDQVSLEERCPLDTFKLPEDNFKKDEEEELPWCFICNDDAVYRCKDCEGDLFCKRCYVEAHNTWGMPDHVYEPFKKK